jgi:murein L,D-transpeptidase YcbB/YkuD
MKTSIATVILSTLIIPAGLCWLLTACRPGTQQQTTSVTPRNTAVNKGNAYNDLFLDSTAVEKFIIKQQLDDTIANMMRSLYNARNFEYIWLDTRGLTEQALGFRSLYDYSQDTAEVNKQLEARLNELAAEDDTTISAGDAGIIITELQLTRRFIDYARLTFDDLSSTRLEQFVPIQKQQTMKLADSVLSRHNDYGEENPAYGKMKEQLLQYVDIAKKGGWPVITADKKKYKKGDQGAVVATIRKRLQITGELPGTDTIAVFDDALETAVKTYQEYHGYTPSGVVSDTLITEMNISATSRIRQLMMNMERIRWAPIEPEGRLIVVNIPEFVLHAWDKNSKAFDMAVVVGREGQHTTMFSGDLNQVVFNPYWHIPRSIVSKDILPELEKNENYLEENDMEVTGERNGLPVIRQRPGKKNALGRVKFLFPNSFNIYLHDTPVKELFEKDKRAYSHGCIRVSDPARLAHYVLEGTQAWPPEKIDSMLSEGDKEKYVKVKDPVPVLIIYYTAWVDEQGKLQFREDIYGHDARLAQKMFSDTPPAP